MKKVLSIIALAFLSYISVALIFVIAQALSHFPFSFGGFFFDNGIHLFWMLALLILYHLFKYAVLLTIMASQKISFSENGTRYIVCGTAICLISALGLVSNFIVADNRSAVAIVTYIAVIIYGALYIVFTNQGEHKCV